MPRFVCLLSVYLSVYVCLSLRFFLCLRVIGRYNDVCEWCYYHVHAYVLRHHWADEVDSVKSCQQPANGQRRDPRRIWSAILRTLEFHVKLPEHLHDDRGHAESHFVTLLRRSDNNELRLCTVQFRLSDRTRRVTRYVYPTRVLAATPVPVTATHCKTAFDLYSIKPCSVKCGTLMYIFRFC